MAAASAAVEYHEAIYTEMDTEAARRARANRVLAVEVNNLKQRLADTEAALTKLTDVVTRAMNLARLHDTELLHVEALVTETAGRVQVIEEELTWDAHDGQTMYGALPAPMSDAA